MTSAGPLALLLLQLATILVASHAAGLLFARLRQPRVIGEIVAGLLLGPTLLGAAWPSAFHALFGDPEAMRALNVLARLGLLLFLFIVGLDFDPRLLRTRGRAAGAISVSGIALPFVLGFAITYPLRHLFDAGRRAKLFPTALFMGAAMSVTAFPLLARIVSQWNLQRNAEGSLAIAAAAVDDVLAWMLLAVVVAFAPAAAGAPAMSPAATLVAIVAYGVVMWLFVTPTLCFLHARACGRGEAALALVIVTMLLSAFATERIGVRGIFGAFVAGLVVPMDHAIVEDAKARIESFVLVVLLPVFFVYAGLQVDPRRLLHWDLAGYTALLTIVACVGKLGGTSLAARLCGLDARASLLVGVLMNTRGLMELIILTVGVQLGVINQTVYGMMVVMALVTTAMASPLIHLLRARGPRTRKDDVTALTAS